jgi:hypothetical protein
MTTLAELKIEIGGRKTKIVVMPSNAARDAGKRYVLVEESAEKAEEWAWRAYLSMSRGNLTPPPEIIRMGLAGLPLILGGGLAYASWSDVQPLLKEMMGCVNIEVAAGGLVRRADLSGDIDEVDTRLMLRKEIVELHLGFTIAEGILKLASLMPTATIDGNG